MTQIDDDDDLQPEPDEIKPQASTLTMVLCFLNVLGVLGFGFLLMMDLSRRQQWAYLSFRHDLAIQGFPVEEESSGFSDAHDLAPLQTLDPEWLKAAYKERRGKDVQERFREATLTLQFIRPQEMEGLPSTVLEGLFKPFGGEPVKTLNEEVARLKQKLPAMIADAAALVKEKVKGQQARRQMLSRVLLSLAVTTDQVVDLDAATRGEQVKVGDLADLLVEAVQRRMTGELLDLLEEFRPWRQGEAGGKDQAADKNAEDDVLRRLVALQPPRGAPLTKDRFRVKLEDLSGLLTKRLEGTLAAEDPHGRKRHGLEKRRSLAFLLFALSGIKQPDGTPLYPPERAEIISGTREFSLAADNLALVLGHLERRVLTAIERDRGQHYVYATGARVTNPDQFAAKLKDLLTRFKAPLDDKTFQQDARQFFAERAGKLETAEQVLTETKGLLTKLKITIPEDNVGIKANEAAFDAAVQGLADNREIGFVGKHHQALKRLQDVLKRIEDQENRLQEVIVQEKEAKRQHDERVGQVAETAAKLIAAREETLRMAADLRQLQDQRFRAQIELADADRRNQLMERRIRYLEQTRKRGKR